MEFRNLDMNDLEAIIALQNAVYDALEDREVLQTLTKEEFAEIIRQGYIIGVFKGDALIATRSMYIPAAEELEHLADDAGISDKSRVIYSEITFIDSASRGRGLQTEMGRELIRRVRESGDFDHILTTVMPGNIPSLKDKFRLGFKIVKTKYKYGGKKRHVMQLNIPEENGTSGEPVKVHYTDTDWMMDNSNHYIGKSMSDEYIIYYKRN
ncbi:MAG TPA: N-acetyltransferase [Candidatus Salinicoccus stercoripullorum]|uniref:N-acetyltransferase n=1 Tax=Candidatus Salinicoccus stercoripullorum TaxID=2838756 RepID=A0A9D1QHX0_9STAP|nr:N-acetyltransferase [Candidatus Salinicoccus stercoripullorum]